jgi:hypothetical protein
MAQLQPRIGEIRTQAGKPDRFARSKDAKREVRRCGSCGKPSLIVCQAWQHSFNGISTQAVTRECRCQACGAEVTLKDPSAIRTMKILAFILAIAIIPLPLMLFRIWRSTRAWDRSPLVEGAPFPPIQHWRGPGNRRCGECGKLARLRSVTRRTHNGIPVGTSCSYECTGCNRKFETESWGGVLFNIFVFVLFAGGAAAYALSQAKLSTTAMLVCGGGVVGGLLLLGVAVARIRDNLRNHILTGAEAAA